MPLIKTSTYSPPFPFKNRHLNTILPAVFRKTEEIECRRIRISTPDSDFLDVEYYARKKETLLILLHGLEGNAKSSYMTGMAKRALVENWDVLAVNYRGCSGEYNLLFKSYHSGKSDDLQCVIDYLPTIGNFKNILLAGFSIGGNIALKYLGEREVKENQINAAVAVSVPCDLEGAANMLAKKNAGIYMNRFLKSLQQKALGKMKLYPDCGIVEQEIKACRNFYDFDNLYTAPAHGYKNAADYWLNNSSLHFLDRIQIPALLINALDDPFLSESCYPYQEAKNPFLFLETPHFGGHLGFVTDLAFRNWWHEERIIHFLKASL